MKFDLNPRRPGFGRQHLSRATALGTPAVCMAVGLILSGCGHHKNTTAAEPKFPPPVVSQNNAPNVNSVPTTAPTPPSTKEDRANSLAGLVADRENARHSDQPARTMPVAVRPLADTPPPPATDSGAPPVPSAAQVAAVERLETPPPSKPADANSPTAAPVLPDPAQAVGPAPGPRPAGAVVGPRRVPAPAPSSTDDDPSAPGQTDTAPPPGSVYRTLAQFDSTAYKPGHLLATLNLSTGSLSASERATLSAAAQKQNEVRGIVRVIGHGATKSASQDHAVTVARELERLGVPRDQLFVGSENENGPTEVFVHY